MLQTLLKGAGPLLPLLLQTMLRRSLSEVDSLHVLPENDAPLLFGVSEIDDSLAAIDKERVAYDAASVVSSMKSLIVGPAMTALVTGPVVKSMIAIAKIVTGHPLIAISALLGLIPLVFGPALKLILAGPALLPALALLKALKLGAFMATPVLVGVAFSALLVGPAVSILLPGIIKHVGTIKSLLPVLLPLLLSGPLGPLLGAVTHLLSPLMAPLSAMLTGPAFTSLLALFKALLSGSTLMPFENGIRTLPIKLAAAVAEAKESPTFSNGSSDAFELLNSHQN
ncbi:MAG: hypothetical protein KVP17_003520 [Porospora cf. gigantea B]|uniref:uncharacterized protein n=1 Tax=Porospora cf. gigantea B TaxID=2853592 RepID=UPI003571BACD|nr:MAG: hypothetical protein KVP17_003520 [Porospora cf. gigantea B]